MGIKRISGGALAALLAGLVMLGPFSVDTYLPAFPQIQASLHASELQVQQTLPAFLFSFAFMMLWHGALSDTFGRRKVILAGLLVFLFATLGCALAPNIETLWACRVLQGLSSGAGAVLGNAIIRDWYEDATAARLLALVSMIFAIGPGIAPIIGGWIVKLLDWRWIFYFVFAYTLVLFLFCYFFLAESLPASARKEFHPLVLFQSYREILTNVPFLLKAGTLALNFSGMFLYVAAAPVFITRILHLGPEHFSWQFIPMVSGIFLGSWLVNRLAGKWPIPRQISAGFLCALGAGIFNLGYHSLFAPALPWSVLPIFLYAFGISMITPGVMLLLLELVPTLRGTLASCQAFSLTMLASITAGAVAPLLAVDIRLLAAGQLTFGMLGLLCWRLARRSHNATSGGAGGSGGQNGESNNESTNKSRNGLPT